MIVSVRFRVDGGTYSACAVYPRVYGVAWESPCHIVQFFGLSPRVRGSLDDRTLDNTCVGSIPASAGQPKNASD